MCFTKKIGATVDISDFENINQTLFNEEIGFVIQIENSQLEKVLKLFEEKNLFAKEIADLNNDNFVIKKNKKIIFEEKIIRLEKYWRETSHAIQSIRDNKEIADSELGLLDSSEYTGLNSNVSFDESQIISFKNIKAKPKVAILREQGVNGQNEMAAAFTLAGFEAQDVHMQDLLDGEISLKNFNGMAVCCLLYTSPSPRD